MGKWVSGGLAVAVALGLGAFGAASTGAPVARVLPAERAVQAQPQPQTPTNTEPPGISVSGEASVVAEPDIAYVTVGVQTEGATAQEAQGRNNEAMQKVIDAIKAAGIANNDIKTVGLDLSPSRDNQGRITGYRATNSVRVTVNVVAQAGPVLDAAFAAGANTAGNIQFSIKDQSALYAQALGAAVASARSKADAIASAMGVTIVSAYRVEETSQAAPVQYARSAAVAAAPAAAPPTPLQAGEQTITAHVRTVYTFR